MEGLGPGTIEHGSTRQGRWLRARRNQIAIWIAVVEGLLVALHQISWWLAIAVAVATMLLYFYVGRTSRWDVVKQGTWILAVSQALVVLVPMLVIVVGTFVLILVAVLAVGALVLLFLERK